MQAVGSNVQGIEIGDPVLLSFRYCSACPQCEAAHPAHCDRFAVDNCVGNANSTTAGENDEPIWTQFFGQSSFAGHSVVNKSCVVNAKGLVENHDELKLFASLGCGFQTGMGAVQNIAQVGPEDVVMITGMGAVGMGALLVCIPSTPFLEGACLISSCRRRRSRVANRFLLSIGSNRGSTWPSASGPPTLSTRVRLHLSSSTMPCGKSSRGESRWS